MVGPSHPPHLARGWLRDFAVDLLGDDVMHGPASFCVLCGLASLRTEYGVLCEHFLQNLCEQGLDSKSPALGYRCLLMQCVNLSKVLCCVGPDCTVLHVCCHDE